MDKNEKKKPDSSRLNLFYIVQVLAKYTDEKHPMSAQEIAEKMGIKYITAYAFFQQKKELFASSFPHLYTSFTNHLIALSCHSDYDCILHPLLRAGIPFIITAYISLFCTAKKRPRFFREHLNLLLKSKNFYDIIFTRGNPK